MFYSKLCIRHVPINKIIYVIVLEIHYLDDNVKYYLIVGLIRFKYQMSILFLFKYLCSISIFNITKIKPSSLIQKRSLFA